MVIFFSHKLVFWGLLCILLSFFYIASMKTSLLASVAVLAGTSLAQNATGTSSSPLTQYTIQAENITAVILPYGCRLTSLLVPDRNGAEQDVVVGYDNGTQYVTDTNTNHTFFGKFEPSISTLRIC